MLQAIPVETCQLLDQICLAMMKKADFFKSKLKGKVKHLLSG